MVNTRKSERPAVSERASDGGRDGVAPAANLVLLNGKIWTGEPVAEPGKSPPAAEIAQAVAICAGRIIAVGDDSEIRPYIAPRTEVIDLQRRFAMPGFIDAHLHFLAGGFQLLQADLKHAESEKEFVENVRAKAEALPEGRWLLGGSWDEEAWSGAKLPTRWMIDPVTRGHPVYLSRYDHHAGLANSEALALAGISKKTPDPEGGSIVRDPATGEPTGLLMDTAQDMVRRIIPKPSEAEAEEALRAALAEARRVGVTSAGNIALGEHSPDGEFTGEVRLLRRAEAEGWLTCRFYEIVPIRDWQRLKSFTSSQGVCDEFIKLGAVKAFADGSVGSRTAWMFESYLDDEKNAGLPTPIMEFHPKPGRAVRKSRLQSGMALLARDAAQAGMQVCIHAIGPRAVAEILDIIQAVGGPDSARRRFRIEHAQHLRREDFERFAKLGVIASMQPYHAIDDGRWVEKRISRELARWSYAWRSMLDAGARLAFGTDWPVAPLNPLFGIYAAVTRATLDAKNPGGWIPEEKITLEQALRAYTAGSAFASFEEEEKGTITAGKLADIVVLSDDLFAISSEKIRDARVEMTVVGGKVVFRGD